LRLLITEATVDPPRVLLSARALLPKPYDEYKASHEVGDKGKAMVERVSKSHVNVRLSNGARGVVHVSNLRWERVDDATALYQPGDTVKVKIIGFDDGRQQVELSAKARLPDPYDEFKSGHRVGETGKVVVERVSKTHVNVRLSNGARGVIHVSNLRWERVEDATALCKPDDSLKATIISFDDDKHQVELSIKELLPKPYVAFKESHKVGDLVEAQVTGMNKSFAYVSLPGGADGSIHVSKLAAHRVSDPSTVVAKGQKVRVLIIGWDEQRSKVQLSLSDAAGGTTTAAASPRSTTRASVASTPFVPSTPKRKRTARAEGKTVAEATAAAAASLRLSPAQVTVRVLEEPTTGMFGRLKGRAIVEATER
jgi:ribosomal protein S1